MPTTSMATCSEESIYDGLWRFSHSLVLHLFHRLPQCHQELAHMRPDGIRLSSMEVMQDRFLPGKLQHEVTSKSQHNQTHSVSPQRVKWAPYLHKL